MSTLSFLFSLKYFAPSIHSCLFQTFLGFLVLHFKFVFILSLVAVLVYRAVCSLLIVLSPLRKLPAFLLACNTHSCGLLRYLPA